MIDAFDAGDSPSRATINARCSRSYELREPTTAPNPLPAKAMLRVLGHPVGPCRLPMGAGPASLDRGARPRWPPTARLEARPMAAPVTRHVPRRSRRDRPQLRRRSSSTDAILLLDCGLMFPDADMLGVDLVLPDFTWLREHADRIVGLHRHPRPRGPRRRLCVPAPRAARSRIYGSALTLGLARNRIEEAGLLDRTELIPSPTASGARSGPFDVRVHPRHALGAARLRHRVPHPAGHDPALGRLQARPHPGRRSPHRPGASWAPSPTNEGVRLLLADSTNADQHGHSRSETSVGGVLYDLFARARGPPHHHRLLRQPHPPRPADRRCRDRATAAWWPPSGCR